MSHFKVLVIWEEPEILLEPYASDFLEEKEESILYTKKEFIDLYRNDKDYEWLTDEEIYKKAINEDWYDDEWEYSIKENWDIYNFYNPDCKYDYYEMWWRWQWSLIVKEEIKQWTVEDRKVDKARIWDLDIEAMKLEIENSLIKMYNNIKKKDKLCYYNKKEIEDVNKYTLEEFLEKYKYEPLSNIFAILDEEDWWIEKWQMWWFGSYEEEITEEEFKKIVKEKLDTLSPDTIITIVDCHI